LLDRFSEHALPEAFLPLHGSHSAFDTCRLLTSDVSQAKDPDGMTAPHKSFRQPATDQRFPQHSADQNAPPVFDGQRFPEAAGWLLGI
jgi:hypothetical protein